MLDFGLLPPEINSALMYAGAGSGPLLAAAAAWDELAIELRSAAASYSSVVAGLTGSWLGPASVSMAAAAAPYAAWMHATATQAERAATQAQAAASAYEAAFAMTVPPPVIAANRRLLMALIATNLLGQNTPAIAATQAYYAEMWAQDAATMFGYAGNSAAASTLTPFAPAPPTTNPSGLAGQGAPVAQAMSAVPSALQGLASPASAPSLLQSLILLTPLNTAVSSAGTAVTSANLGYAAKYDPDGADKLDTILAGLGVTPTGGSGPGALVLSSSTGLGGSGSAVSAGLGRAASLGGLSVPKSWAAATPVQAEGPGAAALTGATAGAAPATAVGLGGAYAGMPLAAVGERGVGSGGADARYALRLNVIPRTPAAR